MKINAKFTKKIIFSIYVFLILIISFDISSCNNVFNPEETGTEAKANQIPNPLLVLQKKGRISFQLSDELLQTAASSNSRTVTPKINLSSLTDINISGDFYGDTGYIQSSYGICECNSVSELSSQQIDLEPGRWDFTLTAKNEGFNFSATQSVNIVIGVVNNITFQLATSDSSGGLNLTINFTGAAGKVIHRINEYQTASDGTLQSSGELTINGSGSEKSVSVIKTATSNPLPNGVYRVYVDFYGAEDTNVLLNTYSEIIRIKSGFVSTAVRSIDLNNLYSITYHPDNGVFPAGSSYVENYSIRSSDITLPDLTKQGYDFDGWYTNSTFTSPVQTVVSVSSAENKEYWAKYTPRGDTPYTVKHLQQAISGSEYIEVNSTQTLYGITNGTTNAAAKTFTGFTAQEITQKTIAADGSTIVEIKYDRNIYDVIYDDGVEDETITVPSTQTGVRFGANVNVKVTATMTRPGYAFAGWKYNGTTYKSGGSTNFTMPDSDVTLTAQWELVSYSITYNTNGGTFQSDYSKPVSYNSETTVTLPTATNITKSGYTFSGWYENSEYTGTTVTSISTGSTGNKTYYAKWTPTSYTITYMVNNGTFTSGYSKPVLYTVESPVTLPTDSDITRVGYTFSGWYESSTFSGSSITVTTATTTGNKIYYAKWTPIIYNITYNNLSGASNPNPTTYTIETETFDLINLTIPGYSFGGWYDNKDDEGNGEGELIENITKGSTGDITLYGNWELAVYSITYNNLKSVTNPAANLRTITMETETFTLTDLTKNYYTFNGWFDNQDVNGNGTGNKITEITKGQTSNIVLYAGWTAIEYTITLNTNGGSYVPGYNPPTSYTKDDEYIKLPTSLQITKDGAVFGGWYQNSGFTTNCYSFANAGAYDTNVTYYAKWLDGVSENGQQAYNQIQSASANANVVITGELSEADLLYMGTALKKKSESVKLDLSGATLTVLPQDVFSDSKITSLTLPSSITDIKSGALKDCPNLTTLIYSGTQDQWKDIHFGRQTSNIWRDNIGTTQVTCSDGSMDFPFFEMKTQAYAAASDPNVSGSNLTNLISGTGTQDDPWVLPENLYAIQVGYRSDSSCGFYTMDLGYFSYGSGPAGSWKLWLDSSKSYEEKVIRCRVSGDFNMIFYIKVSAR